MSPVIVVPRSVSEEYISFDILNDEELAAEPGDILIYDNEFYEVTGFHVKNNEPLGLYLLRLDCWDAD